MNYSSDFNFLGYVLSNSVKLKFMLLMLFVNGITRFDMDDWLVCLVVIYLLITYLSLCFWVLRVALLTDTV